MSPRPVPPPPGQPQRSQGFDPFGGGDPFGGVDPFATPGNAAQPAAYANPFDVAPPAVQVLVCSLWEKSRSPKAGDYGKDERVVDRYKISHL